MVVDTMADCMKEVNTTADYTIAVDMSVGLTIHNTTVADTAAVNKNKKVVDTKVDCTMAMDKTIDCRLVGRMAAGRNSCRKLVDRTVDMKAGSVTSAVDSRNWEPDNSHGSVEDNRLWLIPCCTQLRDMNRA
jgi:hypothetical protein